MSKSLGNVYSIQDLKDKGFSALDYRYFLLNANFRNVQNFTWDALKSAQTSRRNLLQLLLKHKNENTNNTEAVKDYVVKFYNNLNYDLNAPSALGVMWEMAKLPLNKAVYQTAVEMDKVLGLNLEKEVEKLEEKNKLKQIVPENIKKLADERMIAKQNKDYAKSDALRQQIKDMGYSIKDVPNGYEITKD